MADGSVNGDHAFAEHHVAVIAPLDQRGSIRIHEPPRATKRVDLHGVMCARGFDINAIGIRVREALKPKRRLSGYPSQVAIATGIDEELAAAVEPDEREV